MKKMKKGLALLLLAIFTMSIGLVGCGGDKPAEPTAPVSEGDSAAVDVNPWEATVTGDGSLERVVKAGVLTAGLDDAYPPMGYRDPATNEVIGFDIEMAKLIGEKLGVKVEFVPADWNAIVPSLTTKKFDTIISGMNMWDERVAVVNYVPYGVASQVLIVKSDYPSLDAIEDIGYFLDKKVGSQIGSTGAKLLMEGGYEGEKNLTLYKAFPDITLDLDNGRVDAMVIDSFGAGELLKTGKYTEVLTLVEGDGEHGATSAMIGIAVRKDDGDLQIALQQAVNELIADGSLSALSLEWIGTDITEPLQADAQAAVAGK